MVEEVDFVGMWFEKDEPNLVCFHIDVSYLFDLTGSRIVFRFGESRETIALEGLVVMRREVVEDVDARWYFTRMGYYFQGFDKDWMVES